MKSVAVNQSLSHRASLSLPLRVLFEYFNVKDISDTPDINQLNQLAEGFTSQAERRVPEFVEAQQFEHDPRYYETIVAEAAQVPTRDRNWHDAFNAMIWMLFPNSKQRLNRYHIADIKAFGAHPRTPRRNRMTHFDECGVVLAVPASCLEQGNDLLEALAQHHWQRAFCEYQQVWGAQVFPLIFGHAIYEMLLNPFIGLTAKWLAVVVPDEFIAASTARQYALADQALEQRLLEFDGLSSKQVLKPLPVLGVPDWSEGQTDAFYANRDYFRPLSANAQPTLQLPLVGK